VGAEAEAVECTVTVNSNFGDSALIPPCGSQASFADVRSRAAPPSGRSLALEINALSP
jgi:hypothetical protein